MMNEIKAGKRMIVPPTLTTGKLHGWVRAARPGARIAYHVGDLANEREQYLPLQPGDRHARRTEDAEIIHRQARAALQYSEDGVLVLCQIPRRNNDGVRLSGYHYVAVRTDKPIKEKSNG